jgi:hypothetical protein
VTAKGPVGPDAPRDRLAVLRLARIDNGRVVGVQPFASQDDLPGRRGAFYLLWASDETAPN